MPTKPHSVAVLNLAGRGRTSARVNALRGLAALSVVTYHVFLQASDEGVFTLGWETLDGLLQQHADRLGGWGVSVFLVLSGWGLVRSLDRHAPLRHYARRRAARIYPMFWWVAVPTLVVALLGGMLTAADAWKVPVWLMGLNFLSPELFRPLPDLAPQWWYVGLAVQVYVVLPLAWLVLRRFGLFALLITGLAVNGLSLLTIAALPAEWHYLNMGFVGARMLEVVGGMFVYELLARRSARVPQPSRSALLWVGLAGAFGVLALLQPTERVHWLFEISVVAFVALMLWVPVPRLARTSWARFVSDWGGQVSYPLYLCHYAVIALVLEALVGVGAQSTALLLVLSTLISLGVAAGFDWTLAFAQRRLRVSSPVCEELR